MIFSPPPPTAHLQPNRGSRWLYPSGAQQDLWRMWWLLWLRPACCQHWSATVPRCNDLHFIAWPFLADCLGACTGACSHSGVEGTHDDHCTDARTPHSKEDVPLMCASKERHAVCKRLTDAHACPSCLHVCAGGHAVAHACARAGGAPFLAQPAGI